MESSISLSSSSSSFPTSSSAGTGWGSSVMLTAIPGAARPGNIARPVTQRYGRGIDEPSDLDGFVAAFAEWVEACWFAEHERAEARLEALLAFPPDVVLVGALTTLARLLERSDPRAFSPAFGDAADVAGALVEHLLIAGPDPPREALIRAVVTAADAAPAARRQLLATYGAEAVTAAALECASLLAQALANRWGVVPSNVLDDF